MMAVWFQVLIPKLKDPDPNPGVIISVLTAIGEQAQVSGTDMTKWMDDLLEIIIEMLQDSSSVQKREVRSRVKLTLLVDTLGEEHAGTGYMQLMFCAGFTVDPWPAGPEHGLCCRTLQEVPTPP